MSQTIINGDSLKELQKIKENTIDAVITDPPYGIAFLGKDWDSFRATKVARSQVVKNLGTGMRMTTHSENVNYQQWCEQWGRECLRVLKPGGYLLAFSAARLYHRITAGLEDAGFEIRDQIMWLYASGFPKAQDIGKAIDRRQGKANNLKRYDSDKKDNNGVDMGSGVYCPKCNKDSTARYFCKDTDCGMIYKAQTPEAIKWSGWKTALKPAHEPICMARKPFKGSTIDNVLTHGVGALNIDATRIASEPFDYCADGLKRTTYSQSEPAKWNDSDKQMVRNDKGRFPSNVMGEVAGYQKFFYCPKVSRKERHRGFEQDPISHLEMVEQMGGHYVDAEGNQDQSRSGGGNMIWLPHLGKIYTHGLKHEYEQWCKNNNRDPLAHIEKLSNYSQGDVKNHPLWDPSIGTSLQRLKHKIMEHNRDVGPNLDHIPTDSKGKRYYCEIEQRKAVGNNHPTVKPVELMKYLVKLVTPQGAHIVDPFTGSGSTGMACKELNRQFTGIDLDPNYCAIAERRIEATQEDKSETLFE